MPSSHDRPTTTDFQRGAIAMRDAIEAMLRRESEDMERTSKITGKVVEIYAYRGAARLLWSYANGVMMERLPEDMPDVG